MDLELQTLGNTRGEKSLVFSARANEGEDEERITVTVNGVVDMWISVTLPAATSGYATEYIPFGIILIFISLNIELI